MQVLIVDSSFQIIDRLSNLLQETGIPMSVYKAISYPEAVAVAGQIRPDVVLIDRHLPNGQSMRLLDLFKEKRSIVMMMTMRTDADLTAQCKLAGADFVLDKYHEFEKLPAIIQSIVAKN